MNVCLLGWYGSETMGDRAIMDGIMKILDASFNIENVYIGSIVPFYSNRMITEDSDIYFSHNSANLILFPEKERSILKETIKKSDIVAMAGGPILDLKELKIIKEGFKIAKKSNIMTALLGCGYGPFKQDIYKKIAEEILMLSDVSIFRDRFSYQRAIDSLPINKDKYYLLQDPAILSVMNYKLRNGKTRNTLSDSLAINYRNPNLGILDIDSNRIKHELIELIEAGSKYYNKTYLVPMHTFYWGGDDRYYFAELLNNTHLENVEVMYKPLSLYELYSLYSNVDACIGMRYHSIVLQTILNGKNILLDYTERNEGKISGFLEDISISEYSNGRYYRLDNTIKCSEIIDYLYNTNRIDVNFDYDGIVQKYVKLIGGTL